MIGGILIFILTGFISFAAIQWVRVNHPSVNTGVLKNLYWYHILLSFAYYGYILNNPSDSFSYYGKVMMDFRGSTWFSFYGTSTTFIEWLGYPFIRYLGFSFEAIMVLFSFFGFMGFVFFYIFFTENIRFKHSFLNYNLQTIFFFLPNLHFWSSSFGKGSIIFLGIGLFFYGISKIGSRIPAIVMGGLIVYHVRPHVMLVILVSSAIGLIFSAKNISLAWRLLFLGGISVAFFFIYRDVLTLVGINEEEFIGQGLNLSQRARELSKATSGIDLSQYSLPMQVFTFLYRPLFFDAPGILGIVVSVENVFYLYITIRFLINIKGIYFLVISDFLTKTAFFSFLTVSIALAQISGNLGLAMRQKSQVMILLLFVILALLDHQKLKQQTLLERRKKFASRLRPANNTAPS